MKRRLFLVFLLTSMLFASVAYAQSNPLPTATPPISQVNKLDIYVRGGPGESYMPVGRLVLGNVPVPVGRNVDTTWILIKYNVGFGWIRQDLAFWVEDLEALPIVDLNNLTPSPIPGAETRTPFFVTETPEANWVDVGREGAFVRAGPGRGYWRLGTLSNGDVIADPVGRNADLTWIMFRYGDGFGWIQRNLVRWSVDISRLPVLSEDALTPSATFTNTATHTPTYTATATHTPSPTETATSTSTSSATPTSTSSPTLTDTATSTPSATLTNTPTATFTDMPSATFTDMPSATPTSTSSPTLTDTATSTPSVTVTNTPTTTLTNTSNPTLTHTATSTPSATLTNTPTATLTSTSSVTPTSTPSPTLTKTATSTPSATPTSTSSPTLTHTATSTPGVTVTNTPTATLTNTPSPTLTHTATSTPSTTVTSTSSATATDTPSLTSTLTPTLTVTHTPQPSDSPTNTIVPAETAVQAAIVPTAEPPTQTPVPTNTLSRTPTSTSTSSPTSTPSPTLTKTLTPTWTATLTATNTPTSSLTPTNTPSQTLTPTWTATTTNTPSWTPTRAATVTATVPAPTETLAAAVIANTPAPSTTPTLQTPAPDDEGARFPTEAVVAGGILLVVLGYIVVYLRAAAAMDRYDAGFIMEECPVCRRGHLTVETRSERLLGIPRPRRIVRCSVCRSVLRETGYRRWRYAVDRVENLALYERYNGQEIDEDVLKELANQPPISGEPVRPKPPVTPPSFIDDEEN